MAIFLSYILTKPTAHACKTVFEVDMTLYPMACSRNNCKLKYYFFALTQVHLGLLEKNENKSEEMLHILQHCSNEYVPVDSQSNILHKIPFGGDTWLWKGLLALPMQWQMLTALMKGRKV